MQENNTVTRMQKQRCLESLKIIKNKSTKLIELLENDKSENANKFADAYGTLDARDILSNTGEILIYFGKNEDKYY